MVRGRAAPAAQAKLELELPTFELRVLASAKSGKRKSLTDLQHLETSRNHAKQSPDASHALTCPGALLTCTVPVQVIKSH
jgi:hypothetical protein